MSGLLTSRPAPYYGWYIVVVCVFLALVTIGVRGSFGVFIIPMSQDFGWSRTSISLAAILGILVNGATQPFLGSVYDRFGGRKVLLAGLLVLGVSTISCSASPATSSSSPLSCSWLSCPALSSAPQPALSL